MDHTLKYSFKVWVTSAILASILSWLIVFVQVNSIHDFILGLELLLGMPVMIVLTGMFTFPSAIILYFSVRYLTRYYIGFVCTKMILTLLGLLLTSVYVYMLNDFSFHSNIFTLDYLLVVAPYYFAIIISIWIYKLKNFSVDYRISNLKTN
ncbi:hypothetical protein BDD43_2726 [Mucilaginibacter gracilis]|uniref:Uncharacterized protein n=1 Tax=Mucilaginibacter gracilis TaxID=423350 RepID=A0A495J1N0_9SPHI|nr:hypothetical protein BDD43_2726 [Mucilaginibacter gracilis]